MSLNQLQRSIRYISEETIRPSYRKDVATDGRRNGSVPTSTANDRLEDELQRKFEDMKLRHEKSIEECQVKNQMLWTLMQERDSLRRKLRQAERDVETLQKVSHKELAEWAQLVEDMAKEINSLKEANGRADDSLQHGEKISRHQYTRQC